jgi:hypothetical protein
MRNQTIYEASNIKVIKINNKKVKFILGKKTRHGSGIRRKVFSQKEFDKFVFTLLAHTTKRGYTI